MRLRPPKRLWASKAGNSPDEYEDSSMAIYPYRFAPNGGVARAALTDGASESAFARSWAGILADGFAQTPPELAKLNGPAIDRWLEPRQRQWRDAVPWDRLPWHGEAKAKAGAMAAMVGVIFQEKRNGSGLSWQALAVGDCCLFIVREETLALAFPLTDAAQFNNTPSMICSNPANNVGLWERTHRVSGECRPGDLFIMASDAVAYWILREWESGARPWRTLMSLSPGEQWYSWVQSRRADRSMPNDDTTLLIIEVEQPSDVR